jgi:hypothetical protein
MNLPPPGIFQHLIALHARLGESDGADHLDALLKLLAENGLSWSDWPELFASQRLTSSQPGRLRRWVRGTHELVGRASTPNERRKARNALYQAACGRILALGEGFAGHARRYLPR